MPSALAVCHLNVDEWSSWCLIILVEVIIAIFHSRVIWTRIIQIYRQITNTILQRLDVLEIMSSLS